MRLGFREVILLGVLLALPLLSWWLVFRPQNAEIAQARRYQQSCHLCIGRLIRHDQLECRRRLFNTEFLAGQTLLHIVFHLHCSTSSQFFRIFGPSRVSIDSGWN